jgi:hypothetical protein
MRYYLRHGRPDQARQLAEMGAEVFSCGGLQTMAAYLEATGAYDEAEAYILRARERYPDAWNVYWGLIGFYHRMAHVRGVRPYEAKFTKLAKDIFPHGVERVRLASFTAPPTDGAQFVSEPPAFQFGPDAAAFRQAGLRKHDVVVAWDGWRVRTERQFRAVWGFDDDPAFTFIIWRSGNYLEVHARREGRWFEVDVADFKGAATRPTGASSAK